ncbi:MAG: DNA ligase D [Chitinophagaceae bacterium]
MPLTQYKKKRDLRATPEPAGGRAPAAGKLRFVVQKHDARSLHYDFRLEMNGVLKSWAVPKGPSTQPSDKRLAVMVEDHPFDYRNFEGTIPEGNYGAGTVIVWDEGFYEPIVPVKSKKAAEKELNKQLKSGSLKVRLFGSKLKGEYALVHTKQSEKSWLLIKHKDEYATSTDVTRKTRSVKSGKTLEEIGKKNKKKPVKKTTRTSAPKMPVSIPPMLATLSEPFREKGWLYEIKWDGYRTIAHLNGKKSKLVSRNNKSFNQKFYPIFNAIREWDVSAIVDGEVVVVNDKGAANFGQLQNWRSEADGHLLYYLFDVLWLDGTDLTEKPLTERRAILEKLLEKSPSDLLRFSKKFPGTPESLLKKMKQLGLEGIIAKKEDSIYLPGERSKDWLKIKTGLRHEVVIGGYTRNDGSPKPFSSLLVGVYKNGKLHYTGKIGTGFSVELQKELLKKLKALERKTSPFTELPDVNKPSRFRTDPPNAKAVWVTPELVCEVSYTEVTSDGLMRHPSFEGLRTDKPAKNVQEEKTVSHKRKTPGKKKSSTKEPERKTLLNPADKTQERTINGHTLQFTNLHKLYWPKLKIEKRELLNYYYQVAPYILPYLVNRPHSLNRHPNGYAGKNFYQKDVTGKIPDWIETLPYRTDDDPQQKNFLVCTNEASLLYMANLGCIEMNPWSSTVKKPDHPTWCIIDIDPDKNTFDQVIEAARVTHEILEAAGVPSFCKTSGSTGMHIYIPFNSKYDYEQSKEFARLIVTLVQQELPELTSIERQVNKRKGKLYLDFLQNRPQATLAAPYSARPKPYATVSMPLHWEEVKKGLKMEAFTLRNAVNILREKGDVFKGVLGKGISLQKALKKIKSNFTLQNETT